MSSLLTAAEHVASVMIALVILSPLLAVLFFLVALIMGAPLPPKGYPE